MGYLEIYFEGGLKPDLVRFLQEGDQTSFRCTSDEGTENPIVARLSIQTHDLLQYFSFLISSMKTSSFCWL
jgi:hypothetical protein